MSEIKLLKLKTAESIIAEFRKTKKSVFITNPISLVANGNNISLIPWLIGAVDYKEFEITGNVICVTDPEPGLLATYQKKFSPQTPVTSLRGKGLVH